jgi:hypothetical protein
VETSLGKFPFTEVGASMASTSRLYSSTRRCSANDNEPSAAVETGFDRYSIGGIEVAELLPIGRPVKLSAAFDPSAPRMEGRGVSDPGTCV